MWRLILRFSICTPPLPEKEAQKNKGDTLGLRTQQSGRRGLSAIPSKAQAFHQAAALYKTFWANRRALWPEKEHSVFPHTSEESKSSRHIEKQGHLPITAISTQVRQLPKQTAAQKPTLGSKYKWLIQWHAACSSPKQPCLEGDQKVRSALSEIMVFQSYDIRNKYELYIWEDLAWGRAKKPALQRRICTGICMQRAGQVSRIIITASREPKEGSSAKQTCSSGDWELLELLQG